MAKKEKQKDWLECEVPGTLPVLSLKSTVPFPAYVSNVQIVMPENLALLEADKGNNVLVAVAPMIDPEGAIKPENLSSVGLACRIVSRMSLADGTLQVALQGLKRIDLRSFKQQKPYLIANVTCVEESHKDDKETKNYMTLVMGLLEKLIELEPSYPEEFLKILKLNLDNGSRFTDLIPTIIQLPYSKKRLLLETKSVIQRLELLAELLRREIGRAKIARELEHKTEISLEREERVTFLKRQLDVIRSELGERDPMEEELAALTKSVAATDLPAEAKEEALMEIHRLRTFGPRSNESALIRAYLDWMLALPWEKTTKDRLDLKRARNILDAEHYGLAKVKERIIEFLAVRKLGARGKGSVLLIVGPPGTGKTTLGRSIAKALGRKYARISVGGIHDQAEIRGHRRTYVGALPGRILESLRRAGSKNPVIVIDEVDKMESGSQGDPATALLEILDPEQNAAFLDHYLGVPFDLSQVLFVATANLEDYIPEALLDRMEVIYISGYTELEKISIARKHVWPRVIREHGLRGKNVTLSHAALLEMIQQYTLEAGVRELTRVMETVCRKIASQVARGRKGPFVITPLSLKRFLGVPNYSPNQAVKKPGIGVATGLAWTAEGGDLLPIEALSMAGEGRTTLTGYLGEVMKESVSTAFSYVKSQQKKLGIPAEILQNRDIHIHFPEGAIPKDGPSAGIAVATAIASLLAERAVLPGIAMTGEISLRGKVLPVGGVKEKVLAAFRAGIRTVILPDQNRNDLTEIPKEVRKKIRFHFVDHVDKVFGLTLAAQKRRRSGVLRRLRRIGPLQKTALRKRPKRGP